MQVERQLGCCRDVELQMNLQQQRRFVSKKCHYRSHLMQQQQKTLDNESLPNRGVAAGEL